MGTCVHLFKPDSFLLLGFRLFSTSVPGKKAEDPPAPVRRRSAPSSRFFISINVFFLVLLIHFYFPPYDILSLSAHFSDSDDEMEMRLKEAAVSVKDLLPLLVLSPPSMESPCSVKMTKTKKKDTEGEESRVKKKKKKKKNQEDGEQVDSDSTPDAQSNGELTNSEQEHMQVKVKRKKKKKRQEENAEEEALH